MRSFTFVQDDKGWGPPTVIPTEPLHVIPTEPLTVIPTEHSDEGSHPTQPQQPQRPTPKPQLTKTQQK